MLGQSMRVLLGARWGFAACHRLLRWWFAFGFPAFAAVLAIFWLMIARPLSLF